MPMLSALADTQPTERAAAPTPAINPNVVNCRIGFFMTILPK